VLDQAADPDILPRTDVRADLDGKAGVPLQALFRSHGRED
jgi:hypothetical protein